MTQIKRALTGVLLALALLASSAPAGANDGVSPGYYWCYEFDNHVAEDTQWDYTGTQGWRTDTYHHFAECTDGTWYYTQFRYQWSEGYWVWTG